MYMNFIIYKNFVFVEANLTANHDYHRKLSFELFNNYVKNNDIIIIGENHSENSPAFNLLIDYFLNQFAENEEINFNDYCVFLEGLPSYYYKPKQIPEIISAHQFFSWVFFYLGIEIRGLEHPNHLKERIENAKFSILNKKSINSTRHFVPHTDSNEDEFSKRCYMTKRILKNKDFNKSINTEVSKRKYKKIFVICGSVHAVDMSFNTDKLMLDKIYHGISISSKSAKIARLLVEEVKSSRPSKVNDDFYLNQKVKQEDPVSFPANLNIMYKGYFDALITYPHAKNNLSFLVFNKLFASFMWNFKIMSSFFDSNIHEIKTFYEIQQERKSFVYNLPKIFNSHHNLYNSIYKFKIVKLIEKYEKIFNLNYLNDWNPIPDRGLVLRTTNKILNKPKPQMTDFIEKKKWKFSLNCLKNQ